MEILAERTKDGKERNALTIRSIHSLYTIIVDSEPTLKFRWNVERNRWEYCPARMYPYTAMVLDPTEILIRIPIDDTLKVQHYPYVSNLTNCEVAIRMEKSISKVAEMLENIGPPKCLENLKKALELNAKRGNKYSIRPSQPLNTPKKNTKVVQK